MNRFTREMPKDEAIAFIQGMYAAANLAVPNDEQAIKGWADLPYGVQSYFDENRVVVSTCGSAPIWDRGPLPSPIVEYLAEYDRAQKPTAPDLEMALHQLSERLFLQEHKADRLTKDLHSIAAQLWIPPDEQMMGAIGRTLSLILKVADKIGIDGADDIGIDDLEVAIELRLSELLEAEELYQETLPVSYGDRS